MDFKLLFILTIYAAVCSNTLSFFRVPLPPPARRRIIITLRRRIIIASVSTRRTTPPPITNSYPINKAIKKLFCHEIKQKGRKPKYCKVENGWIPIYSRSSSIVACIVVSSLSFITVFIGIIMVFKESRSNELKFWDSLIIIAKLLWSAVDVTLDVFTFYQLNIGKLVDPHDTSEC